MSKSLQRIVVITGGTSGIGKACYDYFKSHGDEVVVIARKNPDELQNFFCCDVSDDENVKNVMSLIGKKFGKIDVLICNAGYGLSGAVELLPEKDTKQLFDVNFFGLVSTYKYAMPYLVEGSIVINMSSACAFFPLPFRGMYCASKSAVNMLTYSQRMECMPLKIKVTAVCPGDVKTNFTKNRVKNYDTNDRYGDRIKNAAENIDSRENKRMSADVVAKKVYKVSLKHSPKSYYIIGAKYRVLNFAMRFLPLRWLINITSKIFGGFKKDKRKLSK